MRRARITYQGAYHHVMNRGYEGKPIFQKNGDKEVFLDLLNIYSKKLRIRIFAYCIMDNHYHLILENSSGRMSDFLKQLNGNYGRIYRKGYGGKGYVFQDRYKSILIQNDPYLIIAVAYVLNNPVNCGITKKFLEYKWSSASLIFNAKIKKSKDDPIIVDIRYMEDIFETKKNFIKTVTEFDTKSLPIVETKVGKIVGEEKFVSKAIKKFDRRNNKESMERKRINDKYFDPVKKIIMEFEKKHKLKIEKVNIAKHAGKKLRRELLFYLRENGGLKYREIIKIDLFSDLKINSLGNLYQKAKNDLDEKKKSKK